MRGEAKRSESDGREARLRDLLPAPRKTGSQEGRKEALINMRT